MFAFFYEDHLVFADFALFYKSCFSKVLSFQVF